MGVWGFPDIGCQVNDKKGIDDVLKDDVLVENGYIGWKKLQRSLAILNKYIFTFLYLHSFTNSLHDHLRVEMSIYHLDIYAVLTTMVFHLENPIQSSMSLWFERGCATLYFIIIICDKSVLILNFLIRTYKLFWNHMPLFVFLNNEMILVL